MDSEGTIFQSAMALRKANMSNRNTRKPLLLRQRDLRSLTGSGLNFMGGNLPIDERVVYWMHCS